MLNGDLQLVHLFRQQLDAAKSAEKDWVRFILCEHADSWPKDRGLQALQLLHGIVHSVRL